MARPRLELHQILQDILPGGRIYFQPPENVKLTYPCIIYKLADINSTKADDIKYLKRKRYDVTLIHTDPDNTVYDTINELPYCDFDRCFINDNLYHYAFTLFF